MTPVLAGGESKGQRSPACDMQLKRRICVDREAGAPAPTVNPAAVKLPTGGHWVLTWREQVLLTGGSPINSPGAWPSGTPCWYREGPCPCPARPAGPRPQTQPGPRSYHVSSANTARVPGNGFQHDDLRTSSSTENGSPFARELS